MTASVSRPATSNQAIAVIAMVGAVLGAAAAVFVAAFLVSRANAPPLLVAAAATLTAGAGGYLLALLKERLRLHHGRSTSSRGLTAPKSRRPNRAMAWGFQVNGREHAMIDLGPAISEELTKELEERMLEIGRPFESGGPLGTAFLPIAGAGAAMLTSLNAGNLFLATAGPLESLMKIGQGVGTAVVERATGQILRHAPFVPAAGALMPVVTPILLFTTLSSMMTSIRFNRIEQTLTGMSEVLHSLLKHMKSDDVAHLLSASSRLRDLHDEYRSGSGFTTDMVTRLAVVEGEVNVLRNKCHTLAKSQVGDLVAAKLSALNRKLLVASTIADVQGDQLRLLLTLQNNPADAERRWSALQEKVETYERDFQRLAEQDPIEEFKEELETTLTEMKWFEKRLLKKAEADRAEATIKELESLTGLSLEDEEAASAALESPKDYSIFFWRDGKGRGDLKVWYTTDYRLEEHADPSSPP